MLNSDTKIADLQIGDGREIEVLFSLVQPVSETKDSVSQNQDKEFVSEKTTDLSATNFRVNSFLLPKPQSSNYVIEPSLEAMSRMTLE